MILRISFSYFNTIILLNYRTLTVHYHCRLWSV